MLVETLIDLAWLVAVALIAYYAGMVNERYTWMDAARKPFAWRETNGERYHVVFCGEVKK